MNAVALILKQRSILWSEQGFTEFSPIWSVEGALFKETQKDLDGMLPYLPEHLSSILDIGCGIGAIDVMLHERYPEAVIHLLDSDEPTPRARKYEYGRTANYSTLCSRDTTLEFMSRHGVQATWHSIGTQPPEVDLVISLSSWGWHYPVSEYVDEVMAKQVILDIREGTEGIQDMRDAGFTHVGAIPKNDKGTREVFQR